MNSKAILESLYHDILSPNKVQETALYLAIQSLILSRYLKSDATACEIASASIYMSFKVCEKKTGLKDLMTKALFDHILGSQGDQTS
jgi:hypothetical protein